MNPRLVLVSILAVLILFANPNIPSGQASPTQALISFTVNMEGDGNDINLGDAICDASPAAGEQCSLRAAVQEANVLSGAQEITVPAGIYLLVGGAGEDEGLSGDLDIKGNLTIDGAGADATIIDGGGNDRIFQVHASTVTINNLTVRNGSTDNGGGINASFSNLTLVNTQVISNTAEAGGGIYLNGSTSIVTINNCDVLSNTAGFVGGGIYNQDAKLTLMDSRVSHNQTTADYSDGGGIHLKWAHGTTISRSTISYNNSDDGGGIFVDSNGQKIIILDSTISNNRAARGGGLHSIGGEIVIGNTTISGNRAAGSGGGLYSDNFYPAEVTMALYNVTIFGNHARADVTSGSGTGGGLYNVDSSISTKNSILAGNNRGWIFPKDDDCKGALVSLDYNLIEETTGCTISGGAAHDQTGLDPTLGFLVDNGGPTLTRMPQVGSPAIDKANPAGCTDTAGAPLGADQRGYPRTVDGDEVGGAVCDVGAVEFALNPVPTLSSLDPASIQAESTDFTLNVSGSDFVDGAVVQWNGSDRPTTFVSSNQLRAQIGAAQVAAEGSATVTVVNPAPGGGASNALDFSITTPPGGENKIYLPIVIR